METNKLKHFTTVFETQNLRQAAELLKMSHSALSKSIKTLEDELQKKLFIPEGRGIVATHDAKHLYQYSKNVLNEVEKLKSYESDRNQKLLKLGTFEVFSTYFLQHLIRDLSEYEIELHELFSGELERAVVSEVVDFAITYEPIPTQGVEFLKLFQVRMAIFGSKSFQCSSKQKKPFAVPLKPLHGSPSNIKGLDGWPSHTTPRYEKYKVDMMQSAIEMARNGKCLVFLPEFVAKLHNNVVLPEFELQKHEHPEGMKPIKRIVYLVKRKNSVEDKMMKKVCKSLRKILQI